MFVNMLKCQNCDGGEFSSKHAHTMRTYLDTTAEEEKKQQDEWVSAMIDTSVNNIKVNARKSFYRQATALI